MVIRGGDYVTVIVYSNYTLVGLRNGHDILSQTL